MMKVAVVGAGVAGQMIIWQLLQNKRDKLSQIDWYSAQEFSPACSKNTSSTVRRAGITMGNNALGDLLYESFDAFEKLVSEHKTFFEPVVDIGVHHQLWSLDHPKASDFERRYGEHKLSTRTRNGHKSVCEKNYVIYPHLLNKAIEKLLSEDGISYNIFKNTYVESITESSTSISVESYRGKKEYKHIFLATGWNYLDTASVELPLREWVAGHYIELDSNCLPDKLRDGSWSMSFEERINFVHRQKTNKLIISARNKKEVELLSDHKLTDELYSEAIEIFPNWNWPQRSEIDRRVGVRVKGIRRMPFAEWITPRVAVINGLYKNAFSFSVKLSQKLVEGIK